MQKSPVKTEMLTVPKRWPLSLSSLVEKKPWDEEPGFTGPPCPKVHPGLSVGDPANPNSRRFSGAGGAETVQAGR